MIRRLRGDAMNVDQGGDPFPLGASPFGPPVPAAMSVDVDAIVVDTSSDIAMSMNSFIAAFNGVVFAARTKPVETNKYKKA